MPVADWLSFYYIKDLDLMLSVYVDDVYTLTMSSLLDQM